MKNLKVRQKLALIGLVFLAPLVPAVAILVRQAHVELGLVLALTAVAIVGALVVGVVLMRDITQPIGALAETARKIAAGAPDAKIDLPPRLDEIGELAGAFQHMIRTQREQKESLVAHNVNMLAAKERAEEADKAKRDFLAVMSHEMRTPLNGILPVAELLGDTQLDRMQREHLRTIRTSAEHLLTLVNDVLDFSKIEAGRLELESAPFELRELLGETIQTLAGRAAERGLELNFHVKPEVPDDLIGDPVRVRQIVMNLVGNALKFTHEGEVTLLVSCAKEGAQEVVLEFRVRDTGIGIAADAISKLFAAFAQGDQSTTRRYGGSGLGLAITKKLVEAMNGSIRVESIVGQGSCFIFTARFEVGEADFEVTMWNDLPRARVLAVDDNATNRLILRDLLQSWGMRVEEADSGAAAMASMRQAHAEGKPFEMVITDMMMPDLDGFGLAEKIRADELLREVRIVMLTSALRPGDVEAGRALGFSALLAKPIRQAILMDTVAEAFGMRRRSKHTQHIDAQNIPAQRPLRILLAEDNATNQRVARLNLESWGHTVVVANNGVEAVDLFDHGGFDLVLMDSQMPTLNGLEATAAIRKREAEGTRVPIVAMTANVVKGFREECLAAGMDGYVSKPLRRDELVREISRVVRGLFDVPMKKDPADGHPERSEPKVSTVEGPGGQQEAQPDVAAAPAAVWPNSDRSESRTKTSREPSPPLRSAQDDSPGSFDPTALLDAVGGDRSVLAQLIALALDEDAPRLLGELDAAASAGDLPGLHAAAHGIKGLVGELKAEPCRSAAAALETAAHESRAADCPALTTALRERWTQLAADLRAFATAGAPS